MNNKVAYYRRIAVMAILIVGLAIVSPAWAQRTEPLPKELEGVGVTEHLGEQIPLDLEFVDSDGKPVALKQYFDGKRPVVLTLNYSNCPMLCSLQLNGLFDTLKQMPWAIGDKFEMITVSFDPLETPERAQLTKQKYLEMYRRAGAAEGWHFLTGKEENIKKLTNDPSRPHRDAGRIKSKSFSGKLGHALGVSPALIAITAIRVAAVDDNSAERTTTYSRSRKVHTGGAHLIRCEDTCRLGIAIRNDYS